MEIGGIIEQLKRRCLAQGMDPSKLPDVGGKRLSEEELKLRLARNQEFIEVTSFFIHKFLEQVSGSQLLVGINDHEGYVLQIKGDPSIVDMMTLIGMGPGVRFTEEEGPNAPALCARLKRPLELRGQDHFHEVLHGLACCAVPLLADGGNRLLGSITIMTGLEFAHPYLLALLTTVADSAERELLLRSQNTQLQILNQVLVDTPYYGLIMTDAQGIVIDMNTPMRRLFEQGMIEAGVGSRVFTIGLVSSHFEQVLIYGQEVVGAELQLRTAEGVHYYLLDVVPIYDPAGELIRVAGSLRDITEMKKTEEMLRNTEKLIFAGRLAVSIAHEIRNPLTTVRGLLQYTGRADKNSGHHDLIMSELDRMNLIVSEFMILGKPQAPLFKSEDCGLILDEVLRIFGIQASMNGIEMKTEIAGTVPINCDRNQIKQVFLNILRNAMEALPFGGHIHLRLEIRDGQQYICIADNGTGMTDDVQQRLGEPFLTAKPDGNGLGMMIVHRIIAAHQGKMTVKSKLGEGTCVELVLP